MPDNHQKPTLIPTALTLADAALLLTKVAGQLVTTAMIETDRAAGAPANADGTINLIHYAAWLVKEVTHGD